MMRPAANSRAHMPWGRLKGPAPGYPAAAARPFNSSRKNVEKPTVSRPRDGRAVTLSGTTSSQNIRWFDGAGRQAALLAGGGTGQPQTPVVGPITSNQRVAA
jgi:hypothetical protein